MSSETNKQILSYQMGVNFEPGETIKMISQPHIKSFYLNEIWKGLHVFLFIFAFIVLTQIISYLGNHNLDWREVLPFLGIIILFGGLVLIRYTLIAQKTTYVITDLNIIIYKDLRRPKTVVINRNNILSKELTKSFIDKYLETGTIQLFTGEMGDNDGHRKKCTIISVRLLNLKKYLL